MRGFILRLVRIQVYMTLTLVSCVRLHSPACASTLTRRGPGGVELALIQDQNDENEPSSMRLLCINFRLAVPHPQAGDTSPRLTFGCMHVASLLNYRGLDGRWRISTSPRITPPHPYPQGLPPTRVPRAALARQHKLHRRPIRRESPEAGLASG